MQNILITGGAGFIGSHLTDRLLSEGYSVTVVDNLYSGSLANISQHLSNPKFKFHQIDVTKEFFFDVDFIFNLACPASPVYYQADPVSTVRTNVLGSINVLELAKKLDCPVLQASTSEVYGDPTISPQSESYLGNVNPIGIRACYDEGKRIAETLFFDYHRQHGVNIKVVRIFNTYGPRMRLDDGRVVSNFVFQALTSSPLTLYGDGSQTRSFCYVNDLVNGLVLMMNSGSKVTGPINLGNPVEFSMRELAELVLKITGSNMTLVYKELPSDDPKQRRPEIAKAKLELGWEPQVGLTEGLALTVTEMSSRIG
jgi:UDP-glucuronate decarboxylase